MPAIPAASQAPPTKSSPRVGRALCELRRSDSDTSMEEVNDDMFEEKTVVGQRKAMISCRERTMTKRSRVRFTQVERGVKDLKAR